MATPTNRRPILKKNVDPFLPSPRFLTESPARQPSSAKPTPHISRPGQPLPPHVFSPSPPLQLRSPIPPPPANLFSGNTSAFNVDPESPFLATVGASDAGNTDRGSINENESPNVGGFVTGLKKAFSKKGSRRQSSNYREAAEDMYYPQMMMMRDSGYAASSRFQEPPPDQPPRLTTVSPSPPPSPQDLPPATSQPPLNDYQATNDQNDAPTAALRDPPSLDSLASAVTARVAYGPDYAKMDRPTPPHSDVSFNTYMIRIQNFVHDLATLPWIAEERVTVDYYPTATERRDKRSSHRPAIVWRSKDYNFADYSDSESSGLKTPHVHIRAPSHASQANLDSEFSSKSSTPSPPKTVRTPDETRVQSTGVRSGLEGEVKSSSPNASKPPLPTSSVQPRWDDPFPNAAPPFVPYWGAPTQLSNTLPSFPPNPGQTPPEISQAYVGDPRSMSLAGGNQVLSKTPPERKTSTMAPTPRYILPPNFGQTPNFTQKYAEELSPRSRSDATPVLLKTPAPRTPSLTQRGGPESLSQKTSRQRSLSRIHGEDPPLRSRSDASLAFSNTTPIQHRPASVRPSKDTFRTTSTSGQRRESHGTPKHEHSTSIPTPSNQQPPTPGSPSRRSHKSHTSSRRPESTEEWERHRRYRPGYVPFERSENYYGTRYGTGIHGLLPPVGPPVFSPASTAPSIKQPQPQYPRPVLMTPPSGTSSSS